MKCGSTRVPVSDRWGFRPTLCPFWLRRPSFSSSIGGLVLPLPPAGFAQDRLCRKAPREVPDTQFTLQQWPWAVLLFLPGVAPGYSVFTQRKHRAPGRSRLVATSQVTQRKHLGWTGQWRTRVTPAPPVSLHSFHDAPMLIGCGGLHKVHKTPRK